MKSVLPLLLVAALMIGTARADGTAAPASGAPDVQTLPKPPKVYGWAFGGAAAGCFVLAGVLGGIAVADASAQNGNVQMPPVYTSGLQKRAGQGQALADAAYAFIGVGAALAVVDAVIWFEILRKPRSAGTTAGEKAAALFSPQGVRF
ncbi:MAG: hypothetical protein ACHQ17_03435 [Polyangia bacterium]|jgi:hypothetical protein